MLEMESVETWEGVAFSLLREVGLDAPPQCAFELAACCGIDVVPCSGSRARLVGGLLRYPSRVRSTRQHGLISHELGHWALARAEERQSERGASHVGGALMLPRGAFGRDLRETEWDIRELQRRHPNCSVELIARRIVELRSAVVTVLDEGRQTARVCSPWLGRPPPPAEVELDALRRCLRSGEAERAGEALGWAFPVVDGRWKRVVMVFDDALISSSRDARGLRPFRGLG